MKQEFSPPFFMDLPFAMKDGKLETVAAAHAKWEENFPVNMVKKYRSNLLKLHRASIRFGL